MKYAPGNDMFKQRRGGSGGDLADHIGGGNYNDDLDDRPLRSEHQPPPGYGEIKPEQQEPPRREIGVEIVVAERKPLFHVLALPLGLRLILAPRPSTPPSNATGSSLSLSSC